MLNIANRYEVPRCTAACLNNQIVEQPRNHILSKLSKEELAAIMADMELVHFDIREPLYEPNAAIETAYFPESGMISIVCLTADGPSIEAVTVGKEGFVGMPLILAQARRQQKLFARYRAVAGLFRLRSF